MQTKFTFGTASRIPTPQLAMKRDGTQGTNGSSLDARPPYQPPSIGPPEPSTSRFRFSPFDGPDDFEIPEWENDLRDQFKAVFMKPDLSTCSIDDTVAEALHIIGPVTQDKMRGLAQVICMYWITKQLRLADPSTFSVKTIALVTRITEHLGCISANAERDFLDELNRLCIKRLKLAWHLYFNEVTNEAPFTPYYGTLVKRATAVITMIGHLFHGGQLQHETILEGLEHVAEWLPSQHALFIIHTLLNQLGREFALERAGSCFIRNLLANFIPLAMELPENDTFRHLVFAINSLAAEWYNGTKSERHNAYGNRMIDFMRTF